LAYSTGWLIKAGLPWKRRYCQVLSLLARNPALADPKVLESLPSSIAALEIIATDLDAKSIQEGVQNGTLHRGLTRKAARAAVRKVRTQALLRKPTIVSP
jgi:hypothetical protein